MSGRRSRRGKAAPEIRSSPRTPRFAPNIWLVFGILTLIGVATYLPILTTPGGWLWDDEGHVTSAALRSAEGLWRIWFDFGATQQYYPVVHSAFWLESHLFGTAQPLPYHWVSVLLHAGSAFLIYLLLRHLAVPGAIAAAMLFLVHPIQVESVAWTSELKNTLSCVFFLGAALCYLRFDDGRDKRPYAAALLLFSLALLSKSVTATLPVLLFVIVWWRRGTLQLKRDIVPLLPLAGLSLAAGIATVWFERTLIGAEGDDFQFTFVERTLIAGRALVFYASAILWPVNFSFNYERWQIDAGALWQYAFPVSAVVMLVAVWRRRAIFAAALVFCLALAPALGFVNVYPFVFSFVADHFQYHAGIALFALIGAALAWLAQRWRFSRFAAAGGLTIIVVFLAAGTYSRSRIFVDSPTLYAATIAQNPNSFLAHNNMAAMMVTRHGPGDLQAAIQHAREALRVKPNNAEARFNLAVALDDLDDVQAAIVEYQELLRSFAAKPPPATKLIAVNRRLGLALARTGRAQESVPYLREAARLDVSDAVPLINLGAALVSLGEPIEAERVLEEAIRRDPGSGGAYYNLGNAFLIQRRYDDAARAFAEVLRLQPQDQQAQAALDRARRLGGK